MADMETAATGNEFLCQSLAIPGYFSADECNRIIETSNNLADVDGIIAGVGLENELRRSRIKTLEPGPETLWIFQKLQTAVIKANESFRFRIEERFREGLQVAEYTGGGHYGWHIDISKFDISTRKLSISIQLSDGKDYEGGDLEFMGPQAGDVPRDIGTIVIFPSYALHRVSPVTKGMRHSLVTWVHGPAFN